MTEREWWIRAELFVAGMALGQQRWWLMVPALIVWAAWEFFTTDSEVKS